MNPKIVVVGYRHIANLAKKVFSNLPPWLEFEVTDLPLRNLNSPDSSCDLQSFFKRGTIVICGDRSASYIRKQIKNFVVQIKVTGFDLLDIIHQIGSKEIVVLNFREKIEEIAKISNLLNVNIRQLQYQNFQEATLLLEKLRFEGVSVVVGGSWIAEAAPQFGMQGVCYYSYPSLISAYQFAFNIIKTYRSEVEKFALFKTIVDMNRSGIISTDIQSKIKVMSKMTENLLGVKSKQAIGKELQEILPNLLGNNPNLLGKEPQYNLIFEHNQKKMAVDVVPVYLHGENMGHILALDDVANLQELERKIRKKINQKPMIANYSFKDIIGSSSTLLESIQHAKKYSQAHSSILIHGESGTGKELFAQSIHRASERSLQPFVAVNCAALPESLIDSELFGYEEGSFTGAKKGGKIGLFELSHQGTIFLDEISELPLHLQSRLLRVLQEKEIVRIGGDQVIPIDVRIIAASNKNLLDCIKEGSFREDLYFRISVLQLSIPALRQRTGDITKLFRHFIRNHEHLASSLTDPELDLLLSYHWPGNVRELENVAERFLVLLAGEKLSPESIQKTLQQALFPTSTLASKKEFSQEKIPSEFSLNQNGFIFSDGKRDIAAHLIRDILERALSPTPSHLGEVPALQDSVQSEADLIQQALILTDGNIKKAAQRLGISRTTLWRKMKGTEKS